MDTPPPETFSDRDLLVALTGHWGLRADSVRYVPKGAGSYHWVVAAGGHSRYFVTVDDLDTKPWISAQRQVAFGGLRVAYETARVLENQAGLSWVVGPLRASDGSVLVLPGPSRAAPCVYCGPKNGGNDEIPRYSRARMHSFSSG